MLSLAPLIQEAINAFAVDASYGTAILTDGRRVAVRRSKTQGTEITSRPTVAA